MSLNIRMENGTHATLRQLADAEKTTMIDVLERAVELYRRQRLFDAHDAAFAALSPEDQAAEAAEVALWDDTLMDGLENEPPWEDEAAPARAKKAAAR